MLALTENDLQGVISAVRRGANPYLKDHKNAGLLHYAASYDMEGKLTKILAEKGLNFNERETSKGGTPVHSAAFTGEI